MSGPGFDIFEIDIDTGRTNSGADTVEIGSDSAGIACIVRDRAAIVGFDLHERCDLPAGPVAVAALISADARADALCGRLRQRLAPEPAPPWPSLSVAICTRDRPESLARLLDSLARQREVLGFEILVVDNDSESPATREVAEAQPGVRYVRERLTGLDFARNRALHETSGDVVAYLDDDVLVEPGWAQALLEAWAGNPDAGAVTGQVMPLSLETEAQVLFERRGGFRRGFRPLRHGATAFRDRLHPCGAGKFGVGANMSFDRGLVLALGGFDEALDTGRPLPGGGDLDMFYRVLRAERPLIYEPRAAVRHEHRRSLAALRRQYYTWGLGFAAFIVKSMRADPSARPALRRMARWSFRYQAARMLGRVRGRDPTSVGMIAAEIWGEIKGFCGEYGRSRRRCATIRERAG